ncbi:IS701 family transposase, partial [Undibacterium sp. TC4M20W]
LTDIARTTKQTAYRIKHGLLDHYLCQQLRNPSISMRFA